MNFEELLFSNLEEKGYFIFDTGLCQEKAIVAKQLEICNVLGVIREHNKGMKDYVWPIKVTEGSSVIKTFSEHNDEAELHTDTQYREVPERYMTLSCIQAASCGGGETILLDSETILNSISDQKELIDALKQKFPIAVPDVFRKDNCPYIEYPIISTYPKFRFRYDTFKRGLLLKSPDNLEEKIEVIEKIHQVLENSPAIERVTLKRGQIIVIDNHRVLHGRTAYEDCNRLLYRVRIDDINYTSKNN